MVALTSQSVSEWRRDLAVINFVDLGLDVHVCVDVSVSVSVLPSWQLANVTHSSAFVALDFRPLVVVRGLLLAAGRPCSYPYGVLGHA